MKNQKGISLITLLITIIVMLVIASIATYNGINSINLARETSAKDKLKAICSAIIKNPDALNISYDDYVILNEADFVAIELPKFYSEEQVVSAKLQSSFETSANYYGLFTDDNYVDIPNFAEPSLISELSLVLEDQKTGKTYDYEYTFYRVNENYQFNIGFDETNGVNRPIIYQDMVALSNDGTSSVADVYEDNWYSYHKDSIQFAKMNYGGRVYAWIPRFAYRIQTFYDGQKRTEVPSSAIDIVYLQGNTNYMANGEILDQSYTIHPAFREEGKEYAGMWVDTQTKRDPIKLQEYNISRLNVTASEPMAHMMTASEMGALLYLIQSIGGSEDFVFAGDEYVAAYLDGASMSDNDGFATIFLKGETGRALPESTYGAALIETPWDRVTETYPTETKPYLIRKFSSNRYDFTNSDGNDLAYVRRVIKLGDEESTLGYDSLARKCTVYFDANGGSVETPSKEVFYGENYGALPQPVRSGYTFVGWRGKNMFNEREKLLAIPEAVYRNGYYQFTSRNAYQTYVGGGNYVYDSFKPNTQYTITFAGYASVNNGVSFGFTYTDGTKSEWKLRNTEQANVCTSTAGKSIHHLFCSYGTQADNYISYIQLEEGDAETEYEPYKIYNSNTKVQKMSNHTLIAEWRQN